MRFWQINVEVLKMHKIVATVSCDLSGPGWKLFKINNNWHAWREEQKRRRKEGGKLERQEKKRAEERRVFEFSEKRRDSTGWIRVSRKQKVREGERRTEKNTVHRSEVPVFLCNV